MIVDTSAIVAILHGEPAAEACLEALAGDSAPKMSAATAVELYAVADSRGLPAQARRVDALLLKLRIEIVPFDQAQAGLARDAYRDFGKGSGSPARLNLGDCFAYALAAQTLEPLLFVGDDFTHTDLVPALAGPGRSGDQRMALDDGVPAGADPDH
ncbi:MAG: type II toxin-antitoxin system VapC family toxin [Bifidobacteriaceae bacterium]|nr:type II toxin-antitoxin system VapC family toxin [Bifidobacteriaceae bacterium]